MNILKKPWFIPIVLTVIIIVAGQLYTSGKLTKAEALPEHDIRSQLETIYDGEVKELILDGSVYKAIVTKTGAEYEVEVDASTGKVLSLFQTKETAKSAIADGKEEIAPPVEDSTEKTDKDQSNNGDNVQGVGTEKPKPDLNEKPAKPEKKQTRVLISEQKAMEIGMAQLPDGTIGEVDDVDFVNSADGGFYVVDIEIVTEDDKDEVTYQIHAITGKVMAVSWDDE